MLNDLLLRLNQLKTEFNESHPKEPWSAEFQTELINDITYHSNKIEGLGLNYHQTISYLRTGLLPSDENFKLSDISELKNHKTILERIFNQYNQLEISEDFIKSIHKELLTYENPNKINDAFRVPGEYKSDFNFVQYRDGSGKLVSKEYMNPLSVPGAMRELVEQINHDLTKIDEQTVDSHPVVISAKAHYLFCDWIHPFFDGNGRIGRLISNLILMKGDFLPIDVKSPEESKVAYMQALIKSTKENMNPILEFWARSLLSTYEENLS